MDTLSAFRALGIAAGLGLMVGLQRERSNSQLAGLRTFPLITLLGAICAMLATTFGGWVLAAGFVSLAAMVVVGNIALLKPRTADPGLTTEIAILLMFSVGAGLASGHEAAAIAVARRRLDLQEPATGPALRELRSEGVLRSIVSPVPSWP